MPDNLLNRRDFSSSLLLSSLAPGVALAQAAVATLGQNAPDFSALVSVLVTYSFDTSLYIHFHEFKDDKMKLSVFISSAFIFMLIISAGVGLILLVIGDAVFNLILPDKNISFFPFGIASARTTSGSGAGALEAGPSSSFTRSRETSVT